MATQIHILTQGKGEQNQEPRGEGYPLSGGRTGCKRGESMGPKDRVAKGAGAPERSPIHSWHWWSHHSEGLPVQCFLRFCGIPGSELLTLFPSCCEEVSVPGGSTVP